MRGSGGGGISDVNLVMEYRDIIGSGVHPYAPKVHNQRRAIRGGVFFFELQSFFPPKMCGGPFIVPVLFSRYFEGGEANTVRQA